MIPGYAPANSAGYSVTPDPVTKALHLAALGLAVLPVRADKTPATARGVHDATTDAELIVDAFIDTGAPLVGVACGASGIVVIDIDRHPGGADGFASLVGADLPHTWAAPSLSGLGQHRVHAAPAVEVTGSKPLPGVDIKAGAGYVVWAGDVPPSRDVFTPAPAWTLAPARAATAPSWTAGVEEWRAGNDGLPEGGVADRVAAMPPHGGIAEPDLYGLALGIVRASRYDEGGAVALDELRARYASGQWAGAKYLDRVDRAIERAITAEGSARLAITDAEVTLPWLTAAGVVAAAEAITAEAARSPYADVAAILSGDLQRPKASIGFRSDEQCLFYAGAVNQLIGDPESGKSLIAAAVAADTLFAGGRVLWIDLDHNGAASILARFRSFGVQVEDLSNVDRFRLVDDAEDADTVRAVVADCKSWTPTLAVIDSQGELLPLFGASSDSADDYTRVNREVSAAIGRTGAGVLVIDHMAKGIESRKYGAGGTVAKKRAADGVMYRVENVVPFAPGSGGKASLSIIKDRHGDIRANTPGGSREPVAATFEILPGAAAHWRFHAPGMWETGASLQDQDVTALSLLDPPPTTVREVKDRLGWGSNRATRALAAWRGVDEEAA